MIIGNIDTTFAIISKISWIVFLIFVVIFFVRSLIRYGFVPAFVRILSFKVLVPLLLVIALNLLSLALVFVEPQQMGVVISVLSPGGVRPQPFEGGLRWIIPLFEEVKLYPVYWQTYTMSGKPAEGQNKGDDSIRARTKDGQEVFVDTSVIFRIDFNQVVRVHIDWQERYVNDLVRPVIRGLVRTEVSQFTVEEVNSSDRKDLEISLDRQLRAEFLDKGLILDKFLLRDITFSVQYGTAIEQKQVALENEVKREREAEQLRVYAQGQADALRVIGEALKENPDLLTYRYIDKLAPNVRVMLVPNNNPLILPLPSLDAVEAGESLTTTAPLTVTDTTLDIDLSEFVPLPDVTTEPVVQDNVEEDANPANVDDEN